MTPPDRPNRTVVEVGGLARTDQAGYGEEFATLAALPGERDTAEPMGGRSVGTRGNG